MLREMAWHLHLTLRHTARPVAIAPRLFSKDASCGDKAAKCDSKNKAKPSCKRTRKPQDCKKTSAPYPSFSECRKEPTPPKSPSECDCLKPDK